MQRAVNPQTGEVLFLVNNQWTAPSQTARNPDSGQMAYLVNNEWQVLDPFKQEEKEDGFFSRVLEAAKPEPFTREVLDVPLKIAEGTVSTTRAITEAFGANNAAAQNIRGVEKYLAELASAQSKQDSKAISAIMKDAEDKGLGEQLKAALSAFATAPVDFLAQAAGSSVPILLGAVAGVPGLVTTAGLTGAGVVKGTIYDTVKEELQKVGASEKEAEERAMAAQEYGGENLDMILAGTALGAVAGRTGVERYILGKIAAKQAAQKGAVRQAVETGVTEAVPEAIQAGQEQLAANIAAQREGLDVPTFRGVAGQAALEAIAGGALGAGIGAAGEAGPAAPPVPPTAAPPTAAAPTPAAPPTPVTPVTPTGAAPGAAPVVPLPPGPDLLGGYADAGNNVEVRITPTPDGRFQVIYVDGNSGQSSDAGIFDDFDGANATAAMLVGVNPATFAPPTAPTPPVTPTPPTTPVSTTPTPPTVPVGTTPTPPTGVPPTIKPTEFTPEEQQALDNYFQGQIPNAQTVFQNRDRSGKGSIAQMQKIASAPDYSLVGPSKVLAEGAPVIISDINIPSEFLGRTDMATASNGQRFPVRYAVIPATKVFTSNLADGTVNPFYGDLSVPGIRAVAGNGRIAGIQEAYKRKTAKNYFNELINDPSHGVDPKGISAMPNPVLVRIMPKGLVPENIGDLSNVSGIAGLEPVDRAKNDLSRLAGKFDLTGLQFTEEGVPQLSTLRQFIQAMPESEQSELINKATGLPNPDANSRLMNAIFYGAYENDALIDLYAATTNPDAKMYLNSLAKVAPKMVKLSGAGDYDIRSKVVEGIENLVSAVRQGVPIKEMPTFVKQGAIGLDPYAQKIMEFIADSGRSTKRISEGLSRLADAAMDASQVSQEPDMFGQVPPRPTLDQVFDSLKGIEQEPDLFGEPPIATTSPAPSKPSAPTKPEEVKFVIDKTSPQINEELQKLDVLGVAKWAIDNAPNEIAKEIAVKVESRLKDFASRNIQMKGPVILNNNKRVKGYAGAVAFKWLPTGFEFTYKLNGLENNKTARSQNGLKYDTILHELIHAATLAQTIGLQRSDPRIKELQNLRTELREKFTNDLRENKFDAVKDEREIHAIRYSLSTIDELMAKGLTDPRVQKYFKDIQVSKKFNAFGKLVDIARRILGLPQNTTSALEALLSVTDKLLSSSLIEIDADLKLRGRTKVSRMSKDDAADNKATEIFLANTNTNIFGQPMPKASWGMPTGSKIEDLIYTLQDKNVDTKRVIQEIEKSGKKIIDAWNPYLQETLYHGRTADQTKNFLDDELKPLLKALRDRNLSMTQVEEYLQNRHAEERNIQNAKRDPTMPDGGSGILTADAKKYLAALTPQQKKDFEDVAKMVDKIVQGTQKLIVSSGQEKQEVVDAWNKAYKHYVPLNREEGDFDVPNVGTGVGSGFAVKGPFSRASVGSGRKVVDIIANVAMQRERAIIRAEKLRVAKAVYALAVTNPNPGFWLPYDPYIKKNPQQVINDLVSMGINPADAQNISAEPTSRQVDPATNTVKEAPNRLLLSSALSLPIRINGEEKFLIFNANDPRAKRMVESLRNLDIDQLSKALSISQMFTQYFAKINTQYNPIFGGINFLRDVQGAMLQLSTTPIAGKQKQVLAGVMPALRGIYGEERAKRKGQPSTNRPWAQLWEEFQKEGAQTGFRDMFSRSQERAEALQQILDPSSWTKSPLGKVFTAGGTLKVPAEMARKAATPVFDWLSDYNQTMENAVRLAAYKVALDQGMTKQQAASVAKNLTVNFNRKGQIGRQMGALYAFFNASVQGTTRMYETLKGPAGKTIIGGGLILGALQAMALAAAGFDEDEPPEFVKERNIVLPTGGSKYITIPMPLGYNVIPNTSRIVTEWFLSGFKDTPKRMSSIFGSVIGMFNPLGNAGWSAQTITPTVLDPVIALTENVDWTGKPIAKEDISSLNPTPGYTRARDTATIVGKGLSEFLNYASGGTKYTPGELSPTPDQIDYLIGQFTGGVGREFMKLEQFGRSQVTGEDLPIYKVPLVGRFVGDSQGLAAERNRFYNNIIQLNKHEREIKGRRENRENVQEYLMDNPDARLFSYANQVERNIQALRKRRDALLERDAPKEQVKAVENQIAVQMKRFNDRVAAAQR